MQIANKAVDIQHLWVIAYTTIDADVRAWRSPYDFCNPSFSWTNIDEPLRCKWICEANGWYVPTELGLAILHENIDRLLEFIA